MRLIDADALKAEMEDIARELFDDNGHFKIHMADVLYTLEDAPTIDAVEVVRCKDCRFWKNEHLCLVMSRYGRIDTKAEHYCSWGERSEE